MENKVLLKNIGQIANYDKKLADEILMFNNEKSNNSSDIVLCQNDNGEYNIIYKDILIHNEAGSAKEADDIVSKIEEKDNSNTLRVIYGLGLGYLADSTAQTITKSKIIVYEPNIDLLNFVLSIANIDALFKENVKICSHKDKLSDYIKLYSNQDTKITISFLSSYKKMNFDDIKSVVSLIEKAQGTHFAYKNTMTKKAPGAIFNTLYNIRKIFKNPSINELKDIYKDKTALVISAGPSLTKNIDIIKNNQDKFVIFAVNPTVRILSENNIKPDFIVNIETVDTTSQFKNIDPKEYYFISEAFASYAFFNLQTRKTFNYISDANFFNPWVRDCLKITDKLETIGTVSYSAFMSAYLMGFKKIILVGQDLAYQDGNCYSKGNQFEKVKCVYDEEQKKYVIKVDDYEEFIQHLSKFHPSEDIARKTAQVMLDFYSKNLYTTKSQDGKDIPTQTGYALFIEYFEKIAKTVKEEKPDIELINSSTGGAQINGFENIALVDVIKNLQPIEKLNLDNYEAHIDKEHINTKIEKLKQSLTTMNKLYFEAVEINKKLLNELKIKKAYTANIEKLIKKHRNSLSEIIKLQDDKEISIIAVPFICKFIDIVDCDYLSDVNKTLEIITELLQIFSWSYKYILKYQKLLSDSQSIIME